MKRGAQAGITVFCHLPPYELSVGLWFSHSPYSPTGKVHVPYTVTLLEVA
jgi:hypothetical protein